MTKDVDLTQTLTLNLDELRKRKEKAEMQGKDTTMINRLISKHQQALSAQDAESKVAEGDSGNTTIDALKNEFARYDYWYEMSDDHREWKKGVASDDRIKGLIQQLGLGKDDVVRLWQEAGRKEEIPLDRFGLAPKKVYHVGKPPTYEDLEEAYSDPSGLWSAASSNAGKMKMWKVYYTDPSSPGAYQTKKFKTRPGGKEDDVIIHFQKKFPGFKINFVEMIGYVGESKGISGPRAKRIF